MFKSTVFIDITHIRFQAIFPPFFPFLSLFLSSKPFEDFFFLQENRITFKSHPKNGRKKQRGPLGEFGHIFNPTKLSELRMERGGYGRRGCKASVVSRMENSQEVKERKKRMIFS